MIRFRFIIVFAISLFVSFSLSCNESGNSEIEKDSLNTTNEFSQDSIKTSLVKTKKVTFLEIGSISCVPCKMMKPILKEIEDEFGDQVNVIFYDIRTPEGNNIAKEYKIQLIPTQVFLDSLGTEYFRHEGFFPKEKILEVLNTQGVN